MKSFRSKPVGWRGESHRHYLAAKGISTKVKLQNRALLKKWDMPASAHVYVDESSGKVVAAYDEKSGVGGAISKKMLDAANKRGILEVGKGKYFLLKEDVPEVEARLKLLGTVRRGLQDVDADLTRVDVDALKAERALAGAGVGLAAAAVTGAQAVPLVAEAEVVGSDGSDVAFMKDAGKQVSSSGHEWDLYETGVTKGGGSVKLGQGSVVPVWKNPIEVPIGENTTFNQLSGVSIDGSHPGMMAGVTPSGSEYIPSLGVRGVAEFGKAKLVGAAQGVGVIGGAAALGVARSGLHKKKYREDLEADEAKEWMKAREGAAGAASEARFEKEFGSRRTVHFPEDRAWMKRIEGRKRKLSISGVPIESDELVKIVKNDDDTVSFRSKGYEKGGKRYPLKMLRDVTKLVEKERWKNK